MEEMPPALLALLFSKGVVAIPSEVSNRQDRPARESAAVSVVPPRVSPVPVAPATQAPVQEKPAPAPVVPAPAPAAPAAPASQSAAPILYFGGFGQQVLIVLSDNSALHINDDALALLTKILAAVRLSMADVAIVNVANQPVQHAALMQQLPAKVCLFFGIDAADLGVPMMFPAFQVQRWSGVQFLQAPGLQQMLVNSPQSVQYKKQLWEALRKIFEV